MTLRIANHIAAYILYEPEVIETGVGPAFRCRYEQEGYRGHDHIGLFFLEHCSEIEEVPEQLELAA